ncbi:31990_t:CDS:2, partial [Racocetra persica]
RLKLGSKRLPHILAFNIEWTYLTNNPQTSNALSKTSFAKPSHAKSTPQVINKTNSQNMNETLTPTTSFVNKTNTSSVNNNIPAEPTYFNTPILQGEQSDTNR